MDLEAKFLSCTFRPFGGRLAIPIRGQATPFKPFRSEREIRFLLTSFCAEHSAMSHEMKIKAEFHAGWIALRFLNDPARAAVHFDALAKRKRRCRGQGQRIGNAAPPRPASRSTSAGPPLRPPGAQAHWAPHHLPAARPRRLCDEPANSVSAGMIADELRITPRAAQNLVADFGVREADRTGALSRLGGH